MSQSEQPKISGTIITLNEAGQIRACIESMRQVCDDIVVVDSFSTDETVAIALEMGAKVYQQRFLTDGPQKNVGLPFCDHDWVLSIDADERLDADMVADILALDLETTRYEAFSFRRKNLFHGKWIRYTSWYPDSVRRLFDRRKADFSDHHSHAVVQTANYKSLDSHIIHYSYDGYGDMLVRMNGYTSRYARAEVDRKRCGVLAPIGHGIGAFIKNYVICRGFLGGFDGFNISLLNALQSYMKYLKLIEAQRNKAAGDWEEPPPRPPLNPVQVTLADLKQGPDSAP